MLADGAMPWQDDIVANRGGQSRSRCRGAAEKSEERANGLVESRP